MTFLQSSGSDPHAAALVRMRRRTSVTAALISCTVMVFSLLVLDSREASELTSLSRTGLGKLSRPVRKSGPLIPAGPTCWRDEKHLFRIRGVDQKHCGQWWKSRISGPVLNTTHLQKSFCCLSRLFVSSVDESGVRSDPPLCLWRSPACCSDRSFHIFCRSCCVKNTQWLKEINRQN